VDWNPGYACNPFTFAGRSADPVFDLVAAGLASKCLTIFDDATGKSLAAETLDEQMNVRHFLQLDHARPIIERWRRECNKARPTNALVGLRLSPYVGRLTT
jgi:hypothetical protein